MRVTTEPRTSIDVDRASAGRPQRKKKGSPEPERLQDVIGHQLRRYYAGLVEEPMPERLRALVDQLTPTEGRQ